MSENIPDPAPPKEDTLLESSALYREFLAEREEVLRHKWLRSEAEGGDVGFENALLDWMVHHRSEWYASRKRA